MPTKNQGKFIEGEGFHVPEKEDTKQSFRHISNTIKEALEGDREKKVYRIAFLPGREGDDKAGILNVKVIYQDGSEESLRLRPIKKYCTCDRNDESI